MTSDFSGQEAAVAGMTMEEYAANGYEPIQKEPEPLVLHYSGLEIRLAQRKVLRNGEKVSPTRNEYGVLTYLTAYLGQVFSKQQICENVWHMDNGIRQSRARRWL